MALTERYLEEDIHPIDIVENLAAFNDWDFDRISDEQIAMRRDAVAYLLDYLAWSPYDEMLKLVCSFEMDPPEEKLPALYQLLNDVNDQCWAGAFTYWPEQKMMVYRYGLVLAGGQDASAQQINAMINAAVLEAERYYPAVQLVLWGDQTPKQAIQVAIAEAYGHA
ncbi:MAG: diacylglyceryl transferase [Sulfitobacter sp. SK025]|nr:MAG: diacylglyceryl transferase [Sulfitobacter sp. SK025]